MFRSVFRSPCGEHRGPQSKHHRETLMNLHLTKQRMLAFAGAAMLSATMVMPALAVDTEFEDDSSKNTYSAINHEACNLEYIPLLSAENINFGTISYDGLNGGAVDNALNPNAAAYVKGAASDINTLQASCNTTYSLTGASVYTGNPTMNADNFLIFIDQPTVPADYAGRRASGDGMASVTYPLKPVGQTNTYTEQFGVYVEVSDTPGAISVLYTVTITTL